MAHVCFYSSILLIVRLICSSHEEMIWLKHGCVLDRCLLLFLDSIEAMILENLRQERMGVLFCF